MRQDLEKWAAHPCQKFPGIPPNPQAWHPGGGGVGFLHLFSLKMSIYFAYFGLESGMVFEGTSGVYEHIYRFNSKWRRKKEKYAISEWLWRIFLFAL